MNQLLYFKPSLSSAARPINTRKWRSSVPDKEQDCIFSRSYCYAVWSAIGNKMSFVHLSICNALMLYIVALRIGVVD